MSDIPTRTRNLVRERSNDQCSRCGARGSQHHHRQRRREGGHGAGNLVYLCGTCHKWAHANPSKAKTDGYIIPISVDDPSAVPIRTFMGWATFDNDGSVQLIENSERSSSGLRS